MFDRAKNYTSAALNEATVGKRSDVASLWLFGQVLRLGGGVFLCRVQKLLRCGKSGCNHALRWKAPPFLEIS